MHNARHSLKFLPMISIQDVFTLKQMRLIGKVKPGLIRGKVMIFKSAREVNGFVLDLVGVARAKLLCPSKLSKEVLYVTAKNALHTHYKAVPVEVDLKPMYEEKELGG